MIGLVRWLLVCLPFLAEGSDTLHLHQNWLFQSKDARSVHLAKVPGVVHLDLMTNGLLPDPFSESNEKIVQFVEQNDWVYINQFDVEGWAEAKNYTLVFEGLDTYAEVRLNGQIILESDNMFRRWEVEVKSLLKPQANSLVVTFRSPIAVHEDRLQGPPYHLTAGNDAGTAKVSVYTRKAPYHFGWDWGPRLVTCGIFRPVYLIAWEDCRFGTPQVFQDSLTSESAQLSIEIPLLGTLPKNAEVQLNIGDGQRLPVENVIFRKEKIRFSTRIPNPIIWKPRSSASPHLYQLEIEISASGRIFFRKEVKTGLRQVRLVREKDAVGEAFYFEVNGQPVFMKGANYVPPDPLIPRITIEKRRQILCAAKDAGMNFVRVWGGGYYEDDAFYDLCDSLGLMVWQDFMFACSMYPGDSAFLANVRAEVADNVLRLRNHPCIIHWNGNNEVDVAWHNWGWQRQFNISPQDSATMWRAYLAIFEDMIPAILTRLDPGRSYTPTSPISNWGKPENFNLGTMHYWGVWHGGDDFSAFRQNVGRFMNEYGFQSYPEMHTIEKFALPYQQKLDSEVMRDHQKSGNGNEKILREVRQLYGEPIDFEDFTYKSQLAQRDAMDAAIRAHRMGRGHCMGTAYWQLNDTWYGPSWSSIDYDGRWKALHHRLRELYADYLLDPRLEGDSLRIWLLAEGEESGSPPRPCKLVYQFQKFDGTQVAKSTFDIRPNLNRPAIAATIAMKPVFAKAKKEEMLLHCYLECDTTTGAYDSPVRLANTIFLFAPTKNLRLSKPKLKFSLSENVLQVESDTFVKDLFLEAPGVRYFHKNYFDLLPHERVEIPFEGTLNNLHLGRFRTCNPKN